MRVNLHLSASLPIKPSFLKITAGYPCLVVILGGEMEMETSVLAWLILSLVAKDWMTVGGMGSFGI